MTGVYNPVLSSDILLPYLRSHSLSLSHQVATAEPDVDPKTWKTAYKLVFKQFQNRGKDDGTPLLFYETHTEVSPSVSKVAWVSVSEKKALTRAKAIGFAKQYWSCGWTSLEQVHAFTQHVSVLVQDTNGRMMCSCHNWGRQFYCCDSVALEHMLKIKLIPSKFTDAHVRNRGTRKPLTPGVLYCLL